MGHRISLDLIEDFWQPKHSKGNVYMSHLEFAIMMKILNDGIVQNVHMHLYH